MPGLKEFPREDRPNVPILFWTFRVMVAIGFVLLVVMIWAGILWRRGRLYEYRPFLWTLVVVHPLGFLATELGWITTEVGRQPWLVYNLMRTAEGVSPIPAGNVIWSLGLFLIIFPVVGASYFLLRPQGAAQGARPLYADPSGSTACRHACSRRHSRGKEGE